MIPSEGRNKGQSPRDRRRRQMRRIAGLPENMQARRYEIPAGVRRSVKTVTESVGNFFKNQRLPETPGQRAFRYLDENPQEREAIMRRQEMTSYKRLVEDKED